jgi:3-phytase
LVLAITGLALLASESQEGERGFDPNHIETVPEILRTPDFLWNEIDSVALWRGGNPPLLVITSKADHAVFVCDAASGQLLHRIGGSQPSIPGSFNRPNGIAVVDDFVFVVERDNRRVQVLSIPEFTSLGTFGEGLLHQPYGISIVSGSEHHRVYITDDYQGEAGTPSHPGERVKLFNVSLEGGTVGSDLVRVFGDREGPGALTVVESLLADPENNRLLLCDEARVDVKVYDLEGNFTGEVFGRGALQIEPEGLILERDDSDPKAGYIVITDQGDLRSVFRVFDRQSLKPLGSFTGDPLVANTDGIAFSPGAWGPFAEGGLFCVHNDLRVQAYDWKDIRGVLALQ